MSENASGSLRPAPGPASPTNSPPSRRSATAPKAGQRTKIPESLGEILKNLCISTPKKIISVAEPASSPAAA
jgi:hypothetical protein